MRAGSQAETRIAPSWVGITESAAAEARNVARWVLAERAISADPTSVSARKRPQTVVLSMGCPVEVKLSKLVVGAAVGRANSGCDKVCRFFAYPSR